MRLAWVIARRELGAATRGPSAAAIVAAMLMVDGLLFNAYAVGAGSQPSAKVLENFFFCCSGTTLVAAIFLAMRLVAEERQSGTMVLLSTSRAGDWDVVLGKYLAAWLLLGLAHVASLYMPLLLLLAGKISWGHIAAGYLGLQLMGGAALALGLLASALAANQLVAAIGGAALVILFVLLWLLSQVASPPIEGMLAYLSLHDRHFRPFMVGLVSSADVVFYVSLTYLALLAAVRGLEARRWR